ncbi:MAG: 5-(carboxyamino)imidazole ribonucleotide synthase [Hyphomicrobiaceae bacterium]|nr:5-(carboxyamino)imidazole ribonucleotide synthase [Hyphomicrobiaceae bacterium]
MTALPPGSTIGILGGGQLGRMLAMAAARLGLKCHVFSDSSGPAFDVAAAHTVGDYHDLKAVRHFAQSVDVVTYEFENVPRATAEAAASVRPVRPSVKALEVAQDRLVEKTFIAGLGLPVAPFAAVDSEDSLLAAVKQLGTPAILKTRRLGYDGKGQARIKSTSTTELAEARSSSGRAPAILEGFVNFQFEVSVLVVRGIDGTECFYDVPLNTHKNGILDTSAVPAPLSSATRTKANEIAGAIADALGYVGVLAVEMFFVGEEASAPLVVNEIAPRVHNSGHWTTDACLVSQFENHIRAVAGWPLGPADRHSDAIMTNLIGADVNEWASLAATPGTAVHFYGKNDPRPGRKMGHVTQLLPKSADVDG